MILHAVAVPVVPAVAWALVDLAIAVTFVVSLGLLWSWKRTIGALFTWLGHKEISASVHGFGFKIAPFGFMLTLNEQAIGALDAAVAGTEHAMVYAFRRMVGAVLWTGQEISGLAVDSYNAIKSMGHATSTTVTKVVTATSNAAVRKLTVAVEGLQHVVIPGIQARVKSLESTVAHGVRAAGHAIASPFPRIGQLEKRVKADAKRLSRVEKALAAGVGTALLVRSLARLGLGWLRCSNVKKAGKSICGMNPALLESLLLDAAVLAVAFDLEQFAKEMQTVTQEAADLIHNWAT